MAGRRLALLLDFGFGALTGSARSVARIRGCLEDRGFTAETLRGPEVTRARVSAALASVRRRLGEGDSFVLYFVGHGERARGAPIAAPPGEPPPSAEVLLLVTQDLFDESGHTPGIAGAELLAWLTPIAEATGDVTVILDCCRAATMTAGPAPRGRAAQARLDEALARATAGLRAKYGVAAPRGAPEPPIVRLVATTAGEIAVEHDMSDGTGSIGLFTDALARVLAAHRDEERTWDELLPELQAIVRAGCPTQRPGVEGPRHRVPFTRRERPPLGEFPCLAARGEWWLRAGTLHGVEPGDRFALGEVVAVADEVGLDHARLITLGEREPPPRTRAPRIACARRQRITAPATGHLPDVVNRLLAAAPELVVAARDLPDVVNRLLAAAPELVVAARDLPDPANRLLAAAPELTVAARDLPDPVNRLLAAAPEFTGDAVAAPAALAWDGDALLLRDRHGAVIHREPDPREPSGAARLVAAVRRVIRWERQSTALGALVADPLVQLAWGRVGDERPLARDGVELRDGEALWVRAWGTGAHPEVYASLFHLRADRTLAHLGESLDHGVPVPRSRSVALGDRPLLVERPRHTPGAATGALLVLTSVRPRSFHGVATDPSEPAHDRDAWTPRGEARPLVGAVLLPYRLAP